MTLGSWSSRAVVLLVLLAAALGLGFSCDKSVNDGSVSVLVTVRTSLGSNNQQSAGDAVLAEPSVSISADGRYVAFTCRATNLSPEEDDNGAVDVFLRDMVGRTTRLVSVNEAGNATANGASGSPSVSADGRYVAFRSTADDIHDDDPDSTEDIFVRDMQLGVTLLASRMAGPDSDKANGSCDHPRISADGNVVVFQSAATNLVGLSDTDATSDIYRRELSGFFLTTLVSQSSAGVKGSGASIKPQVSGDGRYVVFESVANNLVTTAPVGGPDLNPNADCFLRDTLTNTTRRVSLTLQGGDPNQACTSPAISLDGRYVAYKSVASNLHPDDDDGISDIFIHDTDTLDLIVASQHSFGTQAGNGCDLPMLTADGRFVVFSSPSSSLVNGDTNNRHDIFRHDRVTRTTERLSVTTYGGEMNGQSNQPAVSSDGLYVVFVTDATNAADDDTNGAVDVYLRGPPR